MKELSIEEKAKAYDEAIKKAESLYKASEPMSGCNIIIETLFPELKESKDEMIRKEIITILKHKYGKYYNDPKYRNIPQWIAWLEKQGEQKPAEWSEDDEIEIQYLLDTLRYVKDNRNGIIRAHYNDEILDRCTNWLKSLKDRVQPQSKQEWSEEDEEMYKVRSEKYEKYGQC